MFHVEALAITATPLTGTATPLSVTHPEVHHPSFQAAARFTASASFDCTDPKKPCGVPYWTATFRKSPVFALAGADYTVCDATRQIPAGLKFRSVPVQEATRLTLFNRAAAEAPRPRSGPGEEEEGLSRSVVCREVPLPLSKRAHLRRPHSHHTPHTGLEIRRGRQHTCPRAHRLILGTTRPACLHLCFKLHWLVLGPRRMEDSRPYSNSGEGSQPSPRMFGLHLLVPAHLQSGHAVALGDTTRAARPTNSAAVHLAARILQLYGRGGPAEVTPTASGCTGPPTTGIHSAESSR
ncbi:MAG: hypothetical protein ABW185_04795 [Sedimenticola sp.]